MNIVSPIVNRIVSRAVNSVVSGDVEVSPTWSIIEPDTQRYESGNIADASQGTMVVTTLDSATQPTGNEVVFSLDGGDGDSIYLFKTTGNGGLWRVVSNLNGSEQFRQNHPAQALGDGVNVFTVVWVDNDFRFYVNGDLAYRRTNFIAPDNFSKGIALELFGFNDGLPYTTGRVTKAEYYDTALDDATARKKGMNNDILLGVTRTNDLLIVKNGQSNSVGHADGSPSYTNGADMFMIGNDLTRKAYSDPYDSSNSAVFPELSDSTEAKIGAAGYTIDILAGRLNADVGVMGLNVGSSSMQDDWRPDVAYNDGFVNSQKFTSFIQGLKVATQYSSNIIIENWQGESDAFLGVTQADYEGYLRDFINETHKAMGRTFQWRIIGLHDYHVDLIASATESEWNAITTARQNIATEFPTAVFVSLAGISGNTSDRVHLDLAGHQLVAPKIADSIQAA